MTIQEAKDRVAEIRQIFFDKIVDRILDDDSRFVSDEPCGLYLTVGLLLAQKQRMLCKEFIASVAAGTCEDPQAVAKIIRDL